MSAAFPARQMCIRDRPSGIFRLLSKSTDKYFLLFQPVVHADYWMPFDWQGCGIHDASWFTTFGGELYKTCLLYTSTQVLPSLPHNLLLLSNSFLPCSTTFPCQVLCFSEHVLSGYYKINVRAEYVL